MKTEYMEDEQSSTDEPSETVEEVFTSEADIPIIKDSEEFLIGETNSDYPSNMTFYGVNSYNAISIQNEGTFLIQNRTLKKFSNGERIKLSGGTLEWQGFNPRAVNMFQFMGEEYIRLVQHEPVLVYDEISDTLFLVTYEVDDSATYLYVFPNYNVSKIELLGVISSYELDENGLSYTDTDGNTFRYN